MPRDVVRLEFRESIENFLSDWANLFRRTEGIQEYEFDISSVPQEYSLCVEAVLQASGAGIAGISRDEFSITGNFFFGETIFADTETRQPNLDLLLAAYRRTIASIARLHPVENWTGLHVTYCSIDKVDQYLTLARWVNEVNDNSPAVKMMLVPYQHPGEGYPSPVNGHIDAIRLPNKFDADAFQRLNEMATRMILPKNLEDIGIIVRIGIDDDDVWSPWAFQILTEIAEKALNEGGRPIKAIGVGRCAVFYPYDSGTIDLVDFDVAMSGCKMFASRNTRLILGKDFFPYSLPESFTKNVQRSFRSRGADLLLTRSVPIFFIYMRAGSRLSSMGKHDHYIQLHGQHVGVGNADVAHAVFEEREVREWRDAGSPVVFKIDPPNFEARAALDPSRSILRIDLNAEEFLTERGLSFPDDYQLVISYGTKSGRAESALPLDGILEIRPDGWTERTIVRLEDPSGKRLASAWLRGTEPYLS